MDEFTKHYSQQSGGAVEGSGDLSIGPVYRAGFARGQGGRGFGNFIRGIWSYVSPLFKSGAAALGKQALNTGATILSEAAAGGPDANLGNIAKKRLVEARDSMATKMRGAGRRRRRRTKVARPQKTKRVKARRSKRKRRVPRTKLDIFSGMPMPTSRAYKRKR